jgi:magnesium transporter
VLRTVVHRAEPPFRWLDLVGPSRQDLEEVAREYGLTAHAVQDCLDPEHLPKSERAEGTGFVILRAHDEKSPAGADSVQAFTRKVAIFWGRDFVITVHRKDQQYLSHLMQAWQQGRAGPLPGDPIPQLLTDLTNAVVQTYEPPLDMAEAELDRHEGELLGDHDVTVLLRSLYTIKRRVGLTKRLLWRTLGICTRLPNGGERGTAMLQDLKENTESMHFYADELFEDVTNLLNMQIQLAAHRTNQVVQVLTVFSAFFLPLTFIVGIYGMNFEHMPELPHPWGYPAAWLVMAGVSLGIWQWFRRRGWL